MRARNGSVFGLSHFLFYSRGMYPTSDRFFAKEEPSEPVEYKTTQELLHMSPADILQNVRDQQRR